MKRKPTLRQQVISGLRIAGLLLISIAAFLSLVGGFNLILTEETSWSYRVIGIFLVSTLTALLYATARLWAHWLFGIAGCSTLRLAFPAFYVPFFSRTSDGAHIFVWFLCALISAVLTFKYLQRKPKSIEKMGLVVFVLGVAGSTALPSVRPMAIGLVSLAVCEFTVWLSRKRRDQMRSRGSSHPDIEPLSLSK